MGHSGGVSNDWLDDGHGDGASLAPIRAQDPGESAPSVAARGGTWRPRLGSPVFVAVVVGAILVGSAGTVYAIRETIFPPIGASTSRSVWQNPAPADQPTIVPSTTAPAVQLAEITVPVTTVPAATPGETSTSASAVAESATTGPASTGPASSSPSPGLPVVPTVTIEDNSGHGGGDDDSDNSGSGHSGSDDNSGPGSDDDSGSDD